MENSLKERYEQLVTERNQYLYRARESAKLTIPSIMPEEGASGQTGFDTPWQSVGSRGTNNLASKILLAMFPPNSPFFRLTLDEAERAEMSDSSKGEVDEGLTMYERVVTSDIENSKFRSSMYQAARHLIVCGNALLFDADEGMRMYPLDRYVVKRDASGEVWEMIAVDVTLWKALDDDVKATLAGNGERKDSDEVTIYTGIMREGKKYKIWQEIDETKVPKSEGEYPLDATPWIPLRPVALDGESYGRGFVEELFGDLNTLDTLTQAVTEGAGIASLVKFLVDPNGVTDKKDLVETPNGGFCTGRDQDINVLRVDKGGDLNVAHQAIQVISERLAFAFLLNSAARRDAERVTAEEIRFIAQELEDAFGGIYSVLSQELQLPLVRWRIKKLVKSQKLPPLPKEVNTEIITGLEALGRGHEHQRLRAFVGDAAQVIGPEALVEYLEVSEYMKRSAAALNIDTQGLVRQQDEVDQRRQAQQEAAAAAQAQAAQPQQPQQ